MIGRCQVCGRANTRLFWVMHGGRLVQAGRDCYESIKGVPPGAPRVRQEGRGTGGGSAPG